MARRKYVYGRVLIDVARVLSSNFPAVTIVLSGEQLEMLRNVTQYLSAETTYVDAYFTDYYETPSAEDMDSVLSIVADLEVKLMAETNVPWGYYVRWYEIKTDGDADLGTNDLWTDAVDEGYVYVLEFADAANLDSVSTHLFAAGSGTDLVVFHASFDAPSGLSTLTGMTRITLREGDRIRVRFANCTAGDSLQARFWGYKMRVP